MRKDLWSLGIALFAGGLIGGLFADELALHIAYAWCVGALLGGFVAACVVDFQKLCSGVASAYRATIAWRPYAPYWKAAGTMYLGLMSAGCTVAILFLVVLFPDIGRIVTGRFITVIVPVIAVYMLLLALSALRRPRSNTDEEYGKRLQQYTELGSFMLVQLNPIGAPISVVVYAFKGLTYVIKHLPVVSAAVAGAAKLIQVFATETFRNVQSDRRNIAFIFGTIAATLYHLGGHGIAGHVVSLIVGVAAGLVEYEFVSVRWLKISPAK